MSVTRPDTISHSSF